MTDESDIGRVNILKTDDPTEPYYTALMRALDPRLTAGSGPLGAEEARRINAEITEVIPSLTADHLAKMAK